MRVCVCVYKQNFNAEMLVDIHINIVVTYEPPLINSNLCDLNVNRSSRNTKGGSITVQLNSCLTGLESAV
jgi:hypothetical protein